MSARKVNKTNNNLTKSVSDSYSSAASYSPEEREAQLINKYYNLAERRADEGTASPSEILFFLRLGSSNERLKQDLMRTKHELLEAQTEAIKSAKRVEELYEEAMAAFTEYKGSNHTVDDIVRD